MNTAIDVEQHQKEGQGSNHSHIIPYQKDLKWLPVMSAYFHCIESLINGD